MAGNARWRRQGSCPAPEPAPEHAGAVVRWPVRYEHPIAPLFVSPLLAGFEAIASVVAAEIPQRHKGIVMIEVDHGDGPRRVALDFYDFTFVNRECAAEVDLYFKFQYQRGGYPELENVLPGGYVTDKPFLYRHWCRLRALRSQASPRSEVFGRYMLSLSGPVRAAAIERLRADRRFDYTGGTRRTQHTRYLREMARARVSVDLPGQGPFCCRLVEGLAMGCCIVAVRHAAELPVELREGVEIVYCEEDLSDLTDLCATYVRDESRRAPIEAAAARYFDEHLHPVRMAERYLRVVRDGADAARPAGVRDPG
jgi:glycosyl transferase family 1